MPGNDKPVKRSSPTAESDRPSSVLEHAQLYLANSISVFPIARTGEKKPAVELLPRVFNEDTGKYRRSWKPFQEQLPTGDEVDTTWNRPNPPGIALVCGKVSGGLYAPDFDNDGATTFPLFRQLVEEQLPGLWPQLSIVRTPGEGERYHVPVRCPDHDSQPGEVLAKDPNRPKGQQTLIELRGEGQYIVAVGSPGECHPSGGTYQQCSERPPWNPPTLTVEQFKLLLAICRYLNREKAEVPQIAGNRTELRPLDALDRSSIPWRDIFAGSDWEWVKQTDGVDYFRRPGSEHVWSATAGFCRGKDDVPLLYCFTSNAAPFEQCKSYGKGRAFARLFHNDDWSAAASTILAKWPHLDNRRMTPGQSPGNNGQAGSGGPDRGAARPGRQRPEVLDHLAEGRERSGTQEGNGQKPEADSGARDTNHHLTELGNAKRLIQKRGKDLRYVHEWEKWLIWDSVRWRIDASEEVVRIAQATMSSLYRWALEQMWNLRPSSESIEPGEEASRKQKKEELESLQSIQKWCLNSESRRILFNTVTLARSQAGIPVKPDELNRSKLRLNSPNGTVDLTSSQSYPHRREDMLTWLCPTMYNADATCPTWLRALNDIFQGKQQLISYLQRLLGYCLTGETKEQALFVWHGTGSNGKGLILDTIRDIIGPDYFMQARSQLFLNRRGKNEGEEIARLYGKRLVACVETPDGARLDENLIKSLTGQDRLVGRPLYANPFEFDPTHKLILCTNHKPAIRDMSHGMWRRLQLLPFEVRFLTGEENDMENDIRGGALRADKGLRTKLLAEAPGILAWLVAGCLSWLEEGLNPPTEVLAATRAYRESQDFVGQFLEERCCREPEAWCKAGELHTAFKQWSEANGFQGAMNPNQFAEALKEKGIEKGKRSGVRYKGIRLRGPEDWSDVES